MRIDKRSSTKEGLDCYTNSPCQPLRKRIEDGIDNERTDVSV